MGKNNKIKFSGLLAEMARKGENYSTLSNLLNISESSISRRFSGETEWSINEIEIISKYYNKDYYELFT